MTTWRNIIRVRVLSMALLVGLLAPTAWAQDGDGIQTLQEKIERVAAEVGDSVVSITVRTKAPEAPEGLGEDEDLFEMLPPEFRRFFRRRGQGEDGGENGENEREPGDLWRWRREPAPGDQPRMMPRGLGSGIIISEDGYILTNQHVVDDGEQIQVTLADKRQFDARLIGQDPRRDLAVLKIDVDDLPAATLNPDAEVKRGQFVLAIGSPLGYGAGGQASVSFGIISGTRRRLRGMPMGVAGDRFYGNLLQTDAAINPGNSGGPLCNLDGEVIGINVAIASRTGGYMGIGFAIPVDGLTMSIVRQLKEGKAVAYGYLGVMISSPTAEQSETAGAPRGIGAFISAVEPGGPADKAGLMPADLIVEMDGRPIRDSDDLVTQVGRTPPGEEVELTFYRSGEKMTREATVARRGGGEVAAEIEPGARTESWRGMTVRDLTPALRREAGVSEDVEAVYVTDVERSGPAYKAGIRSGDLVDQIGSKRIRDLDDFEDAADDVDGKVFVNVLGRGPQVLEPGD